MISSLNQTFYLFGAHSGQGNCRRASSIELEKDGWGRGNNNNKKNEEN